MMYNMGYMMFNGDREEAEMEALEKIQAHGWKHIQDFLDDVRGFDSHGFHASILELNPDANLKGFSRAKLEFTYKYLVQFLLEQSKQGEGVSVSRAYNNALDAADAMVYRQKYGDLKGINDASYLEHEVVEFEGFIPYEQIPKAQQEASNASQQPSKTVVNDTLPKKSVPGKKRGKRGRPADKREKAKVIFKREEENLRSNKIDVQQLADIMAEESGLAKNTCVVYAYKFKKEGVDDS